MLSKKRKSTLSRIISFSWWKAYSLILFFLFFKMSNLLSNTLCWEVIGSSLNMMLLIHGPEQKTHCACSLCWQLLVRREQLPQWHTWLRHLQHGKGCLTSGSVVTVHLFKPEQPNSRFTAGLPLLCTSVMESLAIYFSNSVEISRSDLLSKTQKKRPKDCKGSVSRSTTHHPQKNNRIIL